MRKAADRMEDDPVHAYVCLPDKGDSHAIGAWKFGDSQFPLSCSALSEKMDAHQAQAHQTSFVKHCACHSCLLLSSSARGLEPFAKHVNQASFSIDSPSASCPFHSRSGDRWQLQQ